MSTLLSYPALPSGQLTYHTWKFLTIVAFVVTLLLPGSLGRRLTIFPSTSYLAVIGDTHDGISDQNSRLPLRSVCMRLLNMFCLIPQAPWQARALHSYELAGDTTSAPIC